MKKYLIYLLPIFSIILSCDSGKTEGKENNAQESPEALNDNKIDLSSLKRSGSDLIEELYEELVDKNPDLKKMENDFETVNTGLHEPIEKLRNYDFKSTTYYSVANYKVTSINDSILRKTIIAIISASKERYLKNTSELSSLQNTISRNNSTLSDSHLVLKILLTVPIIEKYQSENIPDTGSFKKVIGEQQELIKRTKSLTPKF